MFAQENQRLVLIFDCVSSVSFVQAVVSALMKAAESSGPDERDGCGAECVIHAGCCECAQECAGDLRADPVFEGTGDSWPEEGDHEDAGADQLC